jgi:hypothetical protein
MKKLLTICLIMATVFTANAQNGKPTNEETVIFIKRQLELRIGTKVQETESFIFRINKNDFNHSSLNNEKQYIDPSVNKGNIQIKNISQIKWESLDLIKMGENYHNDGLIIVEFKSPYSYYWKSYKIRDDGKEYMYTEGESFSSTLEIFIPIEKYESIKKAFLRLSEIAKEENKDPFKD